MWNMEAAQNPRIPWETAKQLLLDGFGLPPFPEGEKIAPIVPGPGAITGSLPLPRGPGEPLDRLVRRETDRLMEYARSLINHRNAALSPQSGDFL